MLALFVVSGDIRADLFLVLMLVTSTRACSPHRRQRQHSGGLLLVFDARHLHRRMLAPSRISRNIHADFLLFDALHLHRAFSPIAVSGNIRSGFPLVCCSSSPLLMLATSSPPHHSRWRSWGEKRQRGTRK
jgi:hypothetical protein